MSPFSLIAAAALLAIVAMTFAFGGGAVILALPLALIGIAVIFALDVRRRRRQAADVGKVRDEAKTEDVEFTARDKETLVSE